MVATTVAYDLPARYRIAPGDPRERIAMPRPSWSGTERSEMVSQAQRVTVVADAQRIGDAALARTCTIDQVDGLVTADVADPDQVRRLRDADVDVTLV